MKRATILLAICLLSSSVFAHRLNEYLQATTISLSRDKVDLVLRLTPGTDVASKLIEGIGKDVDHHRYLALLAHDYSLTVDGKTVKLNLVSASFPTEEAMKKGIGDVVIEYQTQLDNTPSHQLQLTNTHYKSIAVYLVNCLQPTDTTIRVVNQTRNIDQSIYQLNFVIGGTHQQISEGNSDRRAVIGTYFIQGIKHILTGYDHLLFLCALVLGAAGLWDLIKVVTAFTIAHSITLTLATYGLAHLPGQIVEPIIAASIVFVAIQNIFWPKQAGTYLRLAVAFFFGLFHGLGFARGLLELMHAMPPHIIVWAIVGFSLGVEAGNQIVLLPLYAALQLLKKARNTGNQLSNFQRYASGAVAIAGTYYLCLDLWIYI